MSFSEVGLAGYRVCTFEFEISQRIMPVSGGCATLQMAVQEYMQLCNTIFYVSSATSHMAVQHLLL